MEEKKTDALEMEEEKNAPKEKKGEIIGWGHGVMASLWAPVMGMN